MGVGSLKLSQRQFCKKAVLEINFINHLLKQHFFVDLSMNQWVPKLKKKAFSEINLKKHPLKQHVFGVMSMNQLILNIKQNKIKKQNFILNRVVSSPNNWSELTKSVGYIIL